MRRADFHVAGFDPTNRTHCLRSEYVRGTIILGIEKVPACVRSDVMGTDKPAILVPEETIAPPSPLQRPSRARMAVAFGVAAISDVLAIATVIAPPLQVALDVVTALILFLILGRRWALLPGLITEAIPGMGVFPVWVLVVLSIIIYDGIKKPSKK